METKKLGGQGVVRLKIPIEYRKEFSDDKEWNTIDIPKEQN